MIKSVTSRKHLFGTEQHRRGGVRLPLALFWLILLLPGLASALDLQWARSLAGKGDNPTGTGIAVDSAGNVYVAGTFADTLDCDPGPGTALLIPASMGAGPVEQNVFVAKYDADGHYLWSRSVAGRYTNTWGWPRAITVDHEGNVVFTGILRDSANFNPGFAGGVLHAAGDMDIFMVKYDKDGNYLWARSMGGPSGEFPAGIAVDTANNIFISGSFSGTSDFDPGPAVSLLTATGSQDIFVAKYDGGGNFLWARRMGSTGNSNGNGIAVDRSGNVYTTGAFEYTATFSQTTATLTSYGDWDVFILKYDAQGNFAWAKNLGSPGGVDYGYDIAADKLGNVYACGYFQSTADFDPGPGAAVLTANAPYTAYLAKYDTDGNYQWAFGVGDGYLNFFQSVAVDGIGNVCVAGFFMGSPDFDPGAGVATLTASGGMNTCVARYRADNGNYLWAGTIESNATNAARTIVADVTGAAYVTGGFSDTADMDPGTLLDLHYAEGSSDIFFLKLVCKDTSLTSLNVVSCDTAYLFNGERLTAGGYYVQHYSNVSRCDSAVALHLTFDPMDAPVITVNTFVLGTTQSYATYQWVKDGNPIPGAVNPTLDVTQNGDYQVIVTNAEGCSAVSEIYTVTNATSVNDPSLLNAGIKVYPNPATDWLTVDARVPVHAALITVDGRQLRSWENARNLYLGDLESGIYMLRLTDKQDRLIGFRKVVLQK